MSSEPEKRAIDIVFELVETDPENRASLREHLCANDSKLIEIVDRLWRSHQLSEEAGFLNRGVMDDASPSLFEGTAGGANDSESRSTTDHSQLPPAGRFIPIEILGRGGQGDVWKAIDPDLNREVALKVLGQASRVSASASMRFRREAAVTGMLEHPNIVPIYEAGIMAADESPYYIMRFLREKNLQAAIDNFHSAANTPESYEHGLRAVLERFIDVCDAVAYAHSRGVIHRDLKPANIMLGDFGETLIVDWGLARVLESGNSPTSNTSNSQITPELASINTLEGTITGSPYYMSPEQARGEIVELTSGTDIYSLGAILCVILTGRPAVSLNPRSAATAGTAKISLDEILKRVIEGRIDAPRSIDSRVPKALDAVCRKAMSLQVSDRYMAASSIEEKTASLAADIRHWLNDEPVAAFSDPFHVRVRRWGKKHQTLVVSTTAATLISVVALCVIAVVVLGMNQQLHQANTALVIAESAAKERSRLTEETLRSVIEDLQGGLRNLPGSARLRQKLLRTALSKLQEIGTQYSREAAVEENTVLALHDLGKSMLSFGVDIPMQGETQVGNATADSSPGGIASALFKRALQVSEILVKSSHGDVRMQSLLGRSHMYLAEACSRLNDDPEASQNLEKARALYEELAAQHPDDAKIQREYSSLIERLGEQAYNDGELVRAKEYFTQSMSIDQHILSLNPDSDAAIRDVGISHENLGDVLLEEGDIDGAENAYRRALEIAEPMANKNLEDLLLQRDLSVTISKMAKIAAERRRQNEELVLRGKCLAIDQRLVDDDPFNLLYVQDLAITCNKLGNATRNAGGIEEALGLFEREGQLRKQLVAVDPHNLEFQRRLGIYYKSSGDRERDDGDNERALTSHLKALEIRKSVSDSHFTGLHGRDLASSYQAVAEDYTNFKDGLGLALALQHYRNGIQILEDLVERDLDAVVARKGIEYLTRQADDVLNLVMSLELSTISRFDEQRRAELLVVRAFEFLRKKEFALAATEATHLTEIASANQQHLYEAARVFSQCAQSIQSTDNKEITADQAAQRQAWVENALSMLRRSIDGGFRNSSDARQDSSFMILRKLPEFEQMLSDVTREDPSQK